jgi:hypothetical protein
MGVPDLQDGRPPRDSAGAELASGPVPAETPDEDTTGYRPSAPGTGVAPPRANGTAGSRPAGRSGAHRRSVASPQKQPWPAAPTVTGAPDRSPPPSPAATGPQDQLQPPSRAATGPQDRSWLSSPPGGGRGLPAAPPATGPQARHGRRPGPPADGLDEDGRLAVTREAPGTRRGTVPQAGLHGSGARRGPLRGFPPPPGQPDPVYPPGQFSPWNRASTRAAWLGIAGAGDGIREADPGYSALAVSDAAADLTSTQTWAAIADEPPSNPSLPPRAGRDRGSHTGALPRPRAAEGRAPAGRAPGGRTPGPRGPAGAATGPQGLAGAATGPQGLAGAATGPREPATLGGPGAQARVAPGGGVAARQAAADGAATTRLAPSAPSEAERGRRSRAGASGGLAGDGEEEPEGRRAGRRGRRSTAMMAAMLLAPVLAVLLVVAGYVYLNGKHSAAPAHPAAPSHPTAAASSSPSPTLGPWKHIESRSQDPVPLSVSQLFPAKFARDGASGTLAVSKSGTRCSREVFGSKLAAAIRKAKCTQVLRASYLSTDRKIMATVGVLNLNDVTGAEKAGKAAGATQFIKQLPSRHGPTRNIAKGTGIEVAEVKGHYLILIWTEYANLHAPKGKSQKQKLESFSVGLVAGTANVSLSNRMVTGHP